MFTVQVKLLIKIKKTKFLAQNTYKINVKKILGITFLSSVKKF